MKKSLLYIFCCLILTSMAACHHNEPPTTVTLPISEEFLPVTMTVDRTDKETYDKILDWQRDLIRVDSADELPDDPLGFPDYYRKLNFSNTTLLLYYQLHFWNIESLNSTFIRNTVEKSYLWRMHMGIVDAVFEGDDKPDQINFSRFAILVRKLPEDAPISVEYSMGSFDTDWWE